MLQKIAKKNCIKKKHLLPLKYIRFSLKFFVSAVEIGCRGVQKPPTRIFLSIFFIIDCGVRKRAGYLKLLKA